MLQGNIRAGTRFGIKARLERLNMAATVNLKKGALRVWLVATICWLAFAVFESREGISYWAGYHGSLFSRHDSIGAALRDKSRTKNIILACNLAWESQCPTPVRDGDGAILWLMDNELYAEIHPKEKACLDSPQFLEAVVSEATKLKEPDARKIKNGAACASYALMTVPEIHWLSVIAILLAPVLPILVYLLGFWLYRGFVT